MPKHFGGRVSNLLPTDSTRGNGRGNSSNDFDQYTSSSAASLSCPMPSIRGRSGRGSSGQERSADNDEQDEPTITCSHPAKESAITLVPEAVRTESGHPLPSPSATTTRKPMLSLATQGCDVHSSSPWKSQTRGRRETIQNTSTVERARKKRSVTTLSMIVTSSNPIKPGSRHCPTSPDPSIRWRTGSFNPVTRRHPVHCRGPRNEL